MKESVKQNVPFFKTIWLALNPWRYDEVREKGTGRIFKYFFSFVFLGFIVSVLLMLPAIAGVVYDQLDNFETLVVDVNATMDKPVVFPEKRPYMTIDTREPERMLKEGNILITEKNLHRKTFFGNVKKYPLGPYKDLLENEGIIILMLLLMLPSLLFLFYIGYAIKVLLIILVATILGFIIARIVKFELLFRDVLKTGLLAATPMIIIDVIRMPFNFNVYFAQYIAFLVFFIVGIIKVGEFEGAGRRKKHKHKGKYIDLGKKV